MNYLPIFSPVHGTVRCATEKSVEITINTEKNIIFSPFFGQISVRTSPCYVAVINNKHLDNSFKFSINGTVDADNENMVEYNQDIATNISGTICVIDFGSKFVTVVDRGSVVHAGNTIIGYIKIKKRIIIQSEPKQLITMSVPCFKFGREQIEQSYAYDLYAKKMVDILTKTLGKGNYDICLYHNITDNPKNAYPTAIKNKIMMKINEVIVSETKPSELNIIYLFDFHSFRAKNFHNIRVSDPDVSILFPDCQLLMYVNELVETLKENTINVTSHMVHNHPIVEDFFGYNFKYNLDKYYTTIIPLIVAIRENMDDSKLLIVASAINKWISTINLYIFEKFTAYN